MDRRRETEGSKLPSCLWLTITDPKFVSKILSDGAETLEKSEMLEAALIVSEAAIDYINPAIPSIIEVGGNTKLSTVSNKKVDRMIDVSRRTGMALYKGGSKVD